MFHAHAHRLVSAAILAGVLSCPAVGQSPRFFALEKSGSILKVVRSTDCVSVRHVLNVPGGVVLGQFDNFGLAYSRPRGTWFVASLHDLHELTVGGRLVNSLKYTTVLGPGAWIGGLARSAKKRRLFHAESRPGQGAIVSYDLSKGRPAIVAAATFQLPSQYRIGGIAYDEKRDLFYVGISDGKSSLIRVMRVTDPVFVFVICDVPIPPSTTGKFGAVHGVDYDATRERLALVDENGTVEMGLAFKTPECPILVPLHACTAPRGAPRYHGVVFAGAASRTTGQR